MSVGPAAARQVTPVDTKGILSNGNVRLDERLGVQRQQRQLNMPYEAPMSYALGSILAHRLA